MSNTTPEKTLTVRLESVEDPATGDVRLQMADPPALPVPPDLVVAAVEPEAAESSAAPSVELPEGAPAFHCVDVRPGLAPVCQSFHELQQLVDHMTGVSAVPGCRAFAFRGDRLPTTRHPAPHLVVDGERYPLFDAAVLYAVDDGGDLGPPAALEPALRREGSPFNR